MNYRNLTSSWYFDLAGYEDTLESFENVLQHIGSLPVLDLGCGMGSYLSRFAKGSIGVEISRPNLLHCRDHGLNVVSADLNDTLPFANHSFPCVFCSHVLEHVDAPILLLRECNRILQDNGLLILGLPIEHSRINEIRGDHYFQSHPGHLYSFSLDNIEALFSKTGFRQLRLYYEIRGAQRSYMQPFQKLMNAFPFRWLFSLNMAYWIVAQKLHELV